MASSGSSGSGSAGTYNLLVIAAQRLNYYQLFEGATVGGRRVRVEQASWQQLAVCSYADNGGLVVSLAASPRPLPGSPQGQSRSFNPDFVLLRATTVGDARRLLAPARGAAALERAVDQQPRVVLLLSEQGTRWLALARAYTCTM